jgi:uncharacterized protein (DUF2062 family)
MQRPTPMPRRHFRKFLPSHDSVKKSRYIAPFGSALQHHNLWHLNRWSVAGGVAVGLFCGLVPGPLQMLSAALCAILLRVNLPVALVTTLYSNPFTIVPLYLLAYKLGSWVTGQTIPRSDGRTTRAELVQLRTVDPTADRLGRRDGQTAADRAAVARGYPRGDRISGRSRRLAPIRRDRMA